MQTSIKKGTQCRCVVQISIGGGSTCRWIAALEDAAMRISGLGGKGIDKDVFTDGDSHFAYGMLTGEQVDLHETNRDAKTYKRYIWKVLEEATRSNVCIKTGPSPDKSDGLRKSTWYGIMSAEGLAFDDEGNELGEGQVYLYNAKEGKEPYLGFEDIQDDIKFYFKPKYLMPDPDIDPSVSAPSLPCTSLNFVEDIMDSHCSHLLYNH
ncbi:hypothetical protein I203_102088 [Kwoniella mangroviensis CBS 8507]|uniref:uncharacterized protein n=1 Tax=Kwoniella mangroviensis CBS 8507 TaxID=1296122 RepID=UPI00305A9787